MSLIGNAADFGRAVRAERKERGMTQGDLARLGGCSVRFVSEVERGKKTAELEKALGLLAALDVPLATRPADRAIDGRAEVDRALVRITKDVDSKPGRHPKLTAFLDDGA